MKAPRSSLAPQHPISIARQHRNFFWRPPLERGNAPADPYLNTDAGTMSPFEHGEVFVLDDGGEVWPPFRLAAQLVPAITDVLLMGSCAADYN